MSQAYAPIYRIFQNRMMLVWHFIHSQGQSQWIVLKSEPNEIQTKTNRKKLDVLNHQLYNPRVSCKERKKNKPKIAYILLSSPFMLISID